MGGLLGIVIAVEGIQRFLDRSVVILVHYRGDSSRFFQYTIGILLKPISLSFDRVLGSYPIKELFAVRNGIAKIVDGINRVKWPRLPIVFGVDRVKGFPQRSSIVFHDGQDLFGFVGGVGMVVIGRCSTSRYRKYIRESDAIPFAWILDLK